MRSPALKFVLLIAIVGGGIAVAWKLGLVEWLAGSSPGEIIAVLRGQWWTPFALLGLCFAIGCLPLPVTPVVLSGGAIFGWLPGSVLNVAGCLLGACAGYVLSRGLGREMIGRWIGPEREKRLDRLVADHGIFAMIRARWMLPLVAVNFAGGLSGMKLGPFVLSSLIGLTPPILVYTYVGHLLAESAGADVAVLLRNGALAVFALLFLSLLPALVKRLRKPTG